MINVILIILMGATLWSLVKTGSQKVRLLAYETQWRELDNRNTEAMVALQTLIDSSALRPESYAELSRIVGILQGEDEEYEPASR